MSSPAEVKRFTLIGMIAPLLWASTLPFAKLCAEKIGALTTVTIQYIVSAVLAFIVFYFQGRLKNPEFLYTRTFLKRVSMFVLYLVFFYTAIGLATREQVPMITLLNYLWPPLTMLFSVLLIAQPYRPFVLAGGTLLVCIGLAVEIVGVELPRLIAEAGDPITLIAYSCATLGALTWSLYTVFNRRWGTAAGGTAALPFIFLVSAISLAALRFISGEVSNWTAEIIFPLCYMALTPFVANVCWDLGTRRGSLNFLSLVADGLPWVSLTMTAIWLGIDIPGRAWIAAAFIVAGAVTSRFAVTFPAKKERSL